MQVGTFAVFRNGENGVLIQRISWNPHSDSPFYAGAVFTRDGFREEIKETG